MSDLTLFLLRAARCLYLRRRQIGQTPPSDVAFDTERDARIFSELLASRRPCMVARFGSIELYALAAYLTAKKPRGSYLGYIRGRNPLPIDWNLRAQGSMFNNTGFFPSGDLALLERFCELMLADIHQLDVLGSWIGYERIVDPLHQAEKVHLINLEPYQSESQPWSAQLAGRKVLVVHPFAKSIREQYEQKRTLLFRNPQVLPEFELQCIPAIQSIAGCTPEGFANWFEALDFMKAQIDACDYDVCLIGCGAYGFPLAAHVKRQGKQAVHLGGSLQLLFGIKGKRWVQQYGENNPYLQLFNEHWIYPDDSERPASANRVEEGCYW